MSVDLNTPTGMPAAGAPVSEPMQTPAPSIPSIAAPSTPNVGTAPPVAPASPSGVSFDVLNYLKSKNLDVSRFQSPDQALETLLSSLQGYHQQVQQLQPLATMGQQYAPHADKIQQFLAEQAKQAQPAPQAGWQAPERPDPRYESMLEYDQQYGCYRAPKDMPALQPYADKLNEYREWQRSTIADMTSDPFGTVRKAGLDDWWKEQQQGVLEQVKSLLAEQRANDEDRQFFEQKKKDLYQVDQTGNLLVDPITGQPVLSPKGQAMTRYLQQAADYGINDLSAQRRFAEQMVSAEEATGTLRAAQPAAAPAALATDKRGEFLRNAQQRSAQLDGTWTGSEHGGDPNAPVQNPDARLVDLANAELTKKGLTPRPHGMA